MFDRLFGSRAAVAPDTPDVSPRPPELREPRLPPGQTLTSKWPVLHYQEPGRYDMAAGTFA